MAKENLNNTEVLNMYGTVKEFFDLCNSTSAQDRKNSDSKMRREKIKNLLGQLPPAFTTTYEAISNLEKKMGSAGYHKGLKKLYQFKQEYSSDTTMLSRLVDHRISHEVRRAFYYGKDFDAMHVLLLLDNQFGLDRDFNDRYSRDFRVVDGSYYFNSRWDYPSLRWFITGEGSLEKALEHPDNRMRLLSPAQIDFKGERTETNDLKEVISMGKYLNDWRPMSIYLPDIEILGLPINKKKPVRTSFSILKGYWEHDDMSDEYNRFEMMIGRKRIPDSYVSMSSHNCGIPDDCK